YTYNIIKEGQYPPATYLKYTQRKNGFQIPDNYEVESILKSFGNLTSTGQNNRAKKIANSIHTIFDQIANKNCHLEDEPTLKSIEFDINYKSFYFDVNEKSNEDNKYKARAVVKACNKSQITYEGYRTLASISYDLPREWKVSLERKDITDEINKAISILTINLASPILDDSINSEIHINDTEIINNMQSIIGIDKLQQPKSYTTILYSSNEKYETLYIALQHLIVKLKKFKEDGLNDNQDPNTDATQFSKDARKWLYEFLESDFYQTSDKTPYIHVLVYHVLELMHIHHKFGLAAFSCSAVEKKNHQQVSFFLKKQQKMEEMEINQQL
ncbi:239_t:CDS:2, partial [Racocetra fulgida]